MNKSRSVMLIIISLLMFIGTIFFVIFEEKIPPFFLVSGFMVSGYASIILFAIGLKYFKKESKN